MKEFYFDTADVPSLKRVWRDLKSDISSDLMRGVTTNPAIMNRAGKNSLVEWFETFRDLYSTIKEINCAAKIHVQFPSSNGTLPELEKFASEIDKLGIEDVVFKIPPYSRILDNLHLSKIGWAAFNVTGLAEAGTVLKVSDLVSYASLIPGRMIQAGLPYKDHVSFAVKNSTLTVITGALRNFEQLSDCFRLGSVPTIGLKTWDLILANREVEKLLTLDYNAEDASDFMPPCDERHTQLSRSFFEEMDLNGLPAYNDFIKLL